MAYSWNLLTTAADCDEAIAYAQREKKDLLRLKGNKEASGEDTERLSADVASELAYTTATLAAMDTFLPALPDGTEKEKQLIEQKRLQYRKSVLEKREDRYNALMVLDNELDQERLEAQTAKLDDFIAGATARKAAL